MPADENESRLVNIPEGQAHGIRFEKAENAEWLDSQNQLFQLEGGSLRLGINGQSGLGLALNLSDGIPTGRPIHLRRDMTPEYCDSVDSKLARWATGIFDDLT